MKNKKEYVLSEMGKEIKELENRYYEYFELKKDFEWLYRFFERVMVIIITMCAMDILSKIFNCL